jgi:hypothetical protein
VKSIGPASKVHIPVGARVVDANGRYMIPGLWDMHVHFDDQAKQFYPRFIAHGITDLREMAQRFLFGADSFRVWQHEVMAGARVGPRIFGPSADYTENFSISKSTTTADVLRSIDSLKKAGMIFLKYHDEYGERDRFFAMAREARRIGIPMVGHVPFSVTTSEAADSGIRSIEHIDEYRQCWLNYPEPLGDSAAVEKRCAPETRAYIRNGTWLVPTFATFWLAPERNTVSALTFKDALRMMRMMHRSGVKKFLAGTDWTVRNRASQFLPGLSAAEEVVFFGEAGFTPLEALQTATLNPAQFFHATDSLGTVESGKLADLVLLDSNPLLDIQAVLKVWAVVANGRYFNRATLDSLDPIGTKPGVGLVPLERRREQWYSSNFVASTDTIEVVLTEDLLAHYIALQKDLTEFWPQHAVLNDSAKSYEDYPVVGVGISPFTKRRWAQMRRFDYATLTTKDSALAGLFRKNDLSPEQYWPVQVTLMKNVLRYSLRNVVDHYRTTALNVGDVAAKNLATVEAHRDDLTALGFHF